MATTATTVDVKNLGSETSPKSKNFMSFDSANGAKQIPWQKIVDTIYPVGAIYMSTTSTPPSTLFGGTWEQIQGRFLLASSSAYAAGSTGGEASHTLTTNEMPAHWHNAAYHWESGGGTSYTQGEPWSIVMDSGQGNGIGTWPFGSDVSSGFGLTGGGKGHNNMPPYLAVYMWKRTA